MEGIEFVPGVIAAYFNALIPATDGHELKSACCLCEVLSVSNLGTV